MRHYETVFVLKPTLSEEELSKKVEAVKGVITKEGGEIYNEDKWGRRELAYPIENFNSGYYFLINFKSENTHIPAKLEVFFNLDEDFIRYLTFKINPPKEEAKEEKTSEEATAESKTEGE